MTESCPNLSVYYLTMNLLPFCVRFMQCLWKYHDTKCMFPHLVSAGKYASSIVAISVAYKYNLNSDKNWFTSYCFFLCEPPCTLCFGTSEWIGEFLDQLIRNLAWEVEGYIQINFITLQLVLILYFDLLGSSCFQDRMRSLHLYFHEILFILCWRF